MSNKIEISMDLYEEFVSCLEYSDHNNRLEEVRSLIAASVVDRECSHPEGCNSCS